MYQIFSDFAKNYWGQTMRSNPTTNHLKLMILDDNRQRVTDYTDTVSKDFALFIKK